MRIVLVLLSIVGVAALAAASDGVIEINQAAALAGGITPGDTPGFPVTLSEAGSYRLTGNLDVAVAANAITVAADFVTIDLGGFLLNGTGGAGLHGVATSSSGFRTVVRNGFIDFFSQSGVTLGDQSVVEDLAVTNCEDSGIRLGEHSVARRLQIRNNGSGGSDGGLNVEAGTTYSELVLSNNQPQNLMGGKPIGESLCDGEYCDGPRLRRYYLTTDTYNGMTADDAGNCAAGFHFASMHEISDPSNLAYATTLGVTQADSGAGPPALVDGWVRTGEVPGVFNCFGWATTIPDGGTSVELSMPFNWRDPGERAALWDIAYPLCTSDRPIWCVEDAR